MADEPTIPRKGPDLFAKIGPLPAWAWAALAVTAYLVWSHFHAQGAADASLADDPYADATTYDDGSLPSDYGGLDGVTYGDGSTTPAPTTPPTTTGTGVNYANYKTNKAWSLAVIDSLVANGYPAGQVATAITKYVNRKLLTTQEAAIVNTAIRNYGSPPTPLPVQTEAPKPDPQPTPKPPPRLKPPAGTLHHGPGPQPIGHPKPALHHVMVHNGDTLSAIAAKHHTTASAIYARNRGVIEREAKLHGHATSDNGRWIFPGEVLTV